MRRQLYDGEEEFEPRVVPKPVAKHDCLVAPTVPEVSLIFEKPAEAQASPKDAGTLDSYAAWREQNYSRGPSTTSTTARVSNYSRALALQNATVHKRQERAASADNKQERSPNVGRNRNDRACEKSVKFHCCDTVAESPRQSCHPDNRTRFSPDQRHPGISNSSDTAWDTLKKPQHFQTPQPFYVPSYSNCTVDNNETVKTLLQLVNSQNEQIKNLQLQVDRLVRLQEENYRNKPMCLCSQPLANQVLRSYPMNQSRGVKRNAVENNDGESGKLETALLEQQPAKAFVEQKVSIGVMTSFEFTLQNSPFPLDSEIGEKKEAHREGNNVNRAGGANVADATEPASRYKSTFARKPGTAQLENIVEDSESYLSSSQQQSSNFNASSSAKESSKTYRHPSTDLNQGEGTHRGMYHVDDRRDDGARDGKRLPSADCGNKALVEQSDDYVTTMDGKRSYVEQPVFLNADSYRRQTGEEYRANVGQTRGRVGDSIVLSGADLEILERPPPTPEPSIHVEMQEYTSDDESDKLRHTPKIGWTLYNNVLGQVNEILQHSAVASDKDLNCAEARNVEGEENDTETRAALNTVKAATLEQLRRLGISLTENNEHREASKTLDFDSSIYPRLDHQANMTHATSGVNETNTSMHMKALALKYLSDEQLADIAWQKQESSSLKHVMLSNMQGTNMSLATMRYLERYQLLPGKNNAQAENVQQMYDEASFKPDFKTAAAQTNNNPALRRYPLVQTSGTTCPSRILDLSTLKRQPKLL
ncbi:PREDICTED: uncharacterized protein LOC105558630 [Vollenhovia emeryi]|uniref:uncharacterized protein LOC105558630 n=1 Tax=Vollenhovia emeryi TaxID=411798 RepID=UPI0005F46011|nr:PREDICTED: uncharacterized protein LOC105558630 [Vollenhovia emeryi]